MSGLLILPLPVDLCGQHMQKGRQPITERKKHGCVVITYMGGSQARCSTVSIYIYNKTQQFYSQYIYNKTQQFYSQYRYNKTQQLSGRTIFTLKILSNRNCLNTTLLILFKIIIVPHHRHHHHHYHQRVVVVVVVVVGIAYSNFVALKDLISPHIFYTFG